MSKRFNWTAEKEDALRRLYPDNTADIVARVLGCATTAVSTKAWRMGLCKSKAFFAQAASGRLDGIKGASTRFKSGQRPWNAGQNYQPGGRSVETRFKPGRAPSEARNYAPIGSLRVSKDGYLERKTNDTHPVPARRWTAVHRLVWEAANGPIPARHIVIFKPGQKTAIEAEVTVDRLDCISRAEHVKRNHPRTKNPELGKLVQLKGAITRQVNRITREHNQRNERHTGATA